MIRIANRRENSKRIRTDKAGSFYLYENFSKRVKKASTTK